MCQAVTQHEIWFHHFDFEAKKHNMRWKHPESSPLKKFVSSAGKMMAAIFWDCQGVITVEYYEEGCTTNDAY